MNKGHKIWAGGAIVAIAIAGLGWMLLPPAQSPSTEAPKAGSAQDSGILSVPADRAQLLGIRSEPAAIASQAPLADLPATISPPANARVAVTATLPGVVVRTMVVEGDSVRAGQGLAVISSRDVLTLGADLARANARLGVAQTNAARLTQLDREGIIAGARADEARAMAMEARADVREKSRILGLVDGHGPSGTYTLSAPITGRITRAQIQTGDPVDGSTAPYVIDANGRYEVVAQLPERLVTQVRTGMTVRFGDLSGTVTSVGSTIDAMTRSATLKASLPAAPGVIAGATGTVTVFGAAPDGAVLVPSAAVVDIDGKSTVFIPVRGGYVRRDVTTGGSVDGKTLLLSGVKPGEQVVMTGTSALKALAISQ